jgi:hypothetical protein
LEDSLRLDAQTARAEIKAGTLHGQALLQRFLAVPFFERDVWADVLLGLPEAPPDISDLPRGTVPYWPAGIDEILAMVLEAPLTPDDEFVDLGSGMGRVVILAHLLSGAKASGVELQLPLVQCAKDCSAALGLANVSFVHANALHAELTGSVFFFYSPFTGEVLRNVLDRLEALSKQKPIILCAVGLEFHEEGWLIRRESSIPALTLYNSR